MRKVLVGAALLMAAAPMTIAWAQDQVPAVAEAQETAPGRFLVFFDFDRATLKADARRVIAAAAEEYRRTGQARLALVAHTDRSGNDAYNQRLSERRAAAVRAQLVRDGVPSSVIDDMADGERDPLVQTADGVRESRNRRVEIAFPQAEPARVPAPVAAAEPAPEPRESEPALRPTRGSFTVGGLYGYNLRTSDTDNDEEGQQLGGDVSVSYSLAPNLSFRLGQAAFYTIDSEDEGWGGRSVAGLDLQGDYRFFGAQPYIGANVGYVYGKGLQDGLIVGPELGLKLDISERTFAYVKTAYDYNFRNNIDDGTIYGGAGLGFRF